MKISISLGNTKMGWIPSISLPPGVTCAPNLPCAKKCYAKKAWRMYPATKAAWERNLKIWHKSPDDYFAQIESWLEKKKVELFRFHVSGDIPSQAYLDRVVELAVRMPSKKFLFFTKKAHLDFRGFPSNLCGVLSQWPGLEHKMSKSALLLPRAWMQDGFQDVPESAIECFGNCKACCGMCWNLRKIGRDVVFKLH